MSVPNIISIFRLALVPVFALVFFSGAENASLWSVGVYALAGLSDIADGYIARHYNQITRLGRVLDPLADKLMAFTVIISICVAGIVPLWAVVVFFVKEALMGCGALLMIKRVDDVIPSDHWGKAATVVFFLICVILMLFTGIPKNIAIVMISAALALTVAAFVNYLIKFMRILRHRDRAED